MNLRLNPQNGHLRLPTGGWIAPTLRPADVATLGASLPPTHRDMHTGWQWQDLRFDNQPYTLLLSLGFFHEQLRSCTFSWAAGSSPGSWDDWNEAAEKHLATQLDEWLSQQLGSARTFSWGTAWAGYDQRSAGSSIVLHYNALRNGH